MAEPSEDQITLSAGQRLRQAREQRGWTLDNVAKRLNLRASVVEKLEQDDYDTASPATYTKGYIRAYCRLLELDEKIVLAELSSDRLKSQTESNMQSFSKRTTRQKSENWLTLITWLIGLGFVAMLIYFGYQQATSGSSIVNKSTAPATTNSAAIAPSGSNSTPAATATDDDGVDLGQGSSDTPEQEPQDSASPGQQGLNPAPVQNSTAGSAAPSQTAAAEAAPTGTQSQTQTLEISFKGDCWVRIEDASGKRVLEGVKTAGQSFTLDAAAPYTLRLGAPEMVTVQYQGQPVDLSGFRAGRLAKLTLPQN